MSLYPQPTLHNGALNTTFNTSDFNSSSKLNSTNVTGSLTVAGLGTFNGGVQINGTQNVSGILTATNTTITTGLSLGTGATLTLPSTQAINNTTTLVDTTSGQNISGAKFFSVSLKTPIGTTINTTNDVVDTTSSQSISGAKFYTVSLKTPAATILTTTNDCVDTTNIQSISGAKTFSALLVANGGVQLPLPAALTTSATPAVNCLNYTNAAYTMTMSANITGFTFTNMRAGGQYTIFLTGGASAFTIAVALTGTPAIKTNYATAISVPLSGKAVLTAYYDGTNMFINASAYA